MIKLAASVATSKPDFEIYNDRYGNILVSRMSESRSQAQQKYNRKVRQPSPSRTKVQNCSFVGTTVAPLMTETALHSWRLDFLQTRSCYQWSSVVASYDFEFNSGKNIIARTNACPGQRAIAEYLCRFPVLPLTVEALAQERLVLLVSTATILRFHQKEATAVVCSFCPGPKVFRNINHTHSCME